MGFDCVSRTHVGLKRKLNEDAVLDGTDRRIWAVADGMGGHEAGEVASAKIVEALGNLSPQDDFDKYLEAITNTLADVNNALIEMGRSSLEPKTIGSTVVGIVAAEDSYGCFWAGDSRAYLLRNNAISQISRDHSLVQGLVDAGMIEAKDAESHPNANVVTRAVGASTKFEVDTITGSLREGDIFLLASDGLTRLASEVDLLSELHSNSLEQAADNLITLALNGGAPDNVSLVIVRVT